MMTRNKCNSVKEFVEKQFIKKTIVLVRFLSERSQKDLNTVVVVKRNNPFNTLIQ